MATTTSPEIITTAPERRQNARFLAFDATLAPYINWNAIAQTARELGAHFEARHFDDGTYMVTMFWTYTEP